MGQASSDKIVLTKFLIILGNKDDNESLTKQELYSKILSIARGKIFFNIEEVNDDYQNIRILSSTPFVDSNIGTFDEWPDAEVCHAGIYPKFP